MSLEDQNRMLHILHKNEVSRKHISLIMNDLKKSKIFENIEESNFDDDWDLIEARAYWLFDSNVSYIEKRKALKSLDFKQEECKSTKKYQYITDKEKRIQVKKENLIKKGVIKPDDLPSKKIFINTTRYGRSLLHEAIAMKNIYLVKKYLKSGEYLDIMDNNGHTALEMAYYYNYKEALILLKKYKNS